MSISVEVNEVSFKTDRLASSVRLSKDAKKQKSVANQPPKRKWKYNVRILNSKGAILVLVWNLLVFSYQGLAFETIKILLHSYKRLEAQDIYKYALGLFLESCVPFFIFPIAGWVADAKIGRYKVIRGSIWLMWIGAMLLLTFKLIFYILKYNLPPYNADETTLTWYPAAIICTLFVYALNAIGIAGFQANLIPFGVDQMEDGSSEQYSAFIHWYYWTRNGSLGTIVQLIMQSFKSYCTSSQNTETVAIFDIFILLLQVASVTLVLCLDLVYSNKVLNKDPKVYKPLMKIWKVSKFIAKNKTFVGYRKAITYTDDSPLQRADFAKKAYGGPFDSDYVEDVQTFWKLLVFILSLGLGGMFLNDSVQYTLTMFVDHLQLPPSTTALSNCTVRHTISELIYPTTITVSIVLYEFLVYPFFGKYVPRMFVRVAMGMVCMLLSAIGFLLLDAIGHSTSNSSTCMMCLMDSFREPLSVSMLYTMPLIILMAFGEILTFIPALELILAQSPFEMRGLLIGLFYAFNGCFTTLVTLVLAISAGAYHVTDETCTSAHQKAPLNSLSCGTWFYLTSVLIGLVGVVLFFVGAVWYKKRQRGGRRTLINHQTIIESYYETSSEPQPLY